MGQEHQAGQVGQEHQMAVEEQEVHHQMKHQMVVVELVVHQMKRQTVVVELGVHLKMVWKIQMVGVVQEVHRRKV